MFKLAFVAFICICVSVCLMHVFDSGCSHVIFMSFCCGGVVCWGVFCVVFLFGCSLFVCV